MNEHESDVNQSVTQTTQKKFPSLSLFPFICKEDQCHEIQVCLKKSKMADTSGV